MTGRPRTCTVYYTINEYGEIYHISYSREEVDDLYVRKYKSGLTTEEAITLVKIMKNKYELDRIEIEEEIPEKLKYLKLPPKCHKSRLSSSWNKGIKSNNTYKTSSVKNNNIIKSKKRIWLNDTFINKSCLYCHESEITCLLYYPDMAKINKLNNIIGITSSREEINLVISSQEVVCLNCKSKLDIGLELI
jgi:hypothetical protein